MRKMTGTLLIGFLSPVVQQATAQSIIYVDSSRVMEGNTGLNWTDAYTSLQSALTEATAGDTVWVAKGTYYPSHTASGSVTTGRDAMFYINKDSVQLYGGFAGTESSLDERNILANPTTLSGDIGIPGDNTDNSYHVFYIDGAAAGNITNGTLLDGFTIKDGNASGPSFPDYDGGGLFIYSFGAGKECSPSIFNCSFLGNSSASDGGGIYNYADGGYNYPVLTNCSFSGNNAANNGGAIYNGGAYEGIVNPVFTNCSFSGNNAANNGGALYNYELGGPFPGDVNPVVRNSIILGNSSGIYNDGEITNTISYSMVQDVTDTADGNISATGVTPSDIFVNPVVPSAAPTVSGDYRLVDGSIVVDRGNDSLYEAADGDLANNSLENDLDLSGEVRKVGASIDIGAFESSVPLPVILLYLDAYKVNQSAALEWATASEQNNSGFDIERSGDALNWKTIGFVATRAENGNSVAEITYGFTDGLPQAGTNFYRLRQIDIDGKYEYSQVRSVLFGQNLNISIYPNPAKAEVTITGLAGEEQVNILDISGKIVYQAQAKGKSVNVTLEQWSNGIYHIQITGKEGSMSTFKLVKTK